MPVVGVEPTRVISTRDFEFSGGFSIWCHLVIFKVIWCPALKWKNNRTSNEFLINLRFFVTFPFGSDFSIWNAKKKLEGYLGGMQGKTLLCLGTKRKESQGWWTNFKRENFTGKCLQTIPMFLPWRMQQISWASKARPAWYGASIRTVSGTWRSAEILWSPKNIS